MFSTFICRRCASTKTDLPALVESLLKDINQKHGRQVTGIGTEVLELFKSYPWPGNIRELRNVLERSAIAADRGPIGRQHLPSEFGHAPAGDNLELRACASRWARRWKRPSAN